MTTLEKVLAAIIVALVIFALLVFAGVVDGKATDPGCADGNVCWWGQSYYDGQKTVKPCQNGAWNTGWSNAAKNRCGNRIMHLGNWNNGGVTDWTACLNPGAERPDTHRFSIVAVGVAGSSC